jgi:hypothetical protein
MQPPTPRGTAWHFVRAKCADPFLCRPPLPAGMRFSREVSVHLSVLGTVAQESESEVMAVVAPREPRARRAAAAKPKHEYVELSDSDGDEEADDSDFTPSD